MVPQGKPNAKNVTLVDGRNGSREPGVATAQQSKVEAATSQSVSKRKQRWADSAMQHVLRRGACDAMLELGRMSLLAAGWCSRATNGRKGVVGDAVERSGGCRRRRLHVLRSCDGEGFPKAGVPSSSEGR